jgi:hypothetical protein
MMNKLHEAVNKFEETCMEYAKYGAGDSEPDGVFQRTLAIAYKKGTNSSRASGEFWQLYTESMDCSVAANALHKAASKAAEIVLNATIRDKDELYEYLEGYCWRCSYLLD